MSDRLEVTYNSKGDHKASHYLPAVHLNILQSDSMQKSNLQQDLSISTVANDGKKRRRTIYLIAIGSAVMLLFLFHRLSSPKEIESATIQIVSDEPQQSGVVIDDSLITQRINPLLTEEAVNHGCIIVTGTFGNERNANIMLSSIKSGGYTAYQSSNESLIRVGLQFHCVGVDLDSMLLSVRETFSEKAWYLVPQYEPQF